MEEPHRRVIVVDDNDAVRHGMEQILSRFGFTAEGFASGRAAQDRIEALEKRDDLPVLVISDMQMPEVTGLELYRRLRERFAKLPFLLYSGYHTSNEVRHLQEQDPLFHYLEKPFSIAGLREAIATLLPDWFS